MLKSLSIKNIAVIADALVEFSAGLNILTGETGAGKSIVIDAINLILGNRFSRDMIRTGEDKVRVEAFFDLEEGLCEKLLEFGVECDGELLITREMNQEGKGTVRINGNLATATMLKSIGPLLIHIHGQHDNQDLLNSDKHLDILDSFSKSEPLLSAYRTLYQEAAALNRELLSIETDEQESERKLALLQYEIDAIEGANLKEGEYEELLEQRKLAANSIRIVEGLNEGYQLLYGGGNFESAHGLLSRTLKRAQDLAGFSPQLSEIADKISQAFYGVEDVALELRDYLDSFEFDETSIDYIEARIDVWNEMRRRFGQSYEEIMDYYEKASKEAKNIRFAGERVAQLTEALEGKKKELRKAGEALSRFRQEGAKRLEEIVMAELEDLNMPNAIFKVQMESLDKFLKDGIDRVEFLLAANAGIAPGKLSKIASGGELSRIMLAINSALLHIEEVPTMIYDEIDAGVSGRAAQKIAEKLYGVSNNRQVLCVTHLSQIAAMADHHYLIEKNVLDHQTKTTVKALSKEERVEEIARILGGVSISHHTIESARDMLLQSDVFKKEMNS